MANLEVDLGFIKLKNPLMTASGTFGYGLEFRPFFDLNDAGAMILKGIYQNPKVGNPPPRIHETASGLLNSIGLAGPGADELKKMIRELSIVTSTPIVVNVCGETDDEYQEVAETFAAMDEVSMLELNISCPNVKKGGQCPAQDKTHTYKLVRKVKQAINKPLLVKLSPNVTRISDIAVAAESAGADALTLVNTFLGMAVDIKSRKPIFAKVFAGLSGPAIKPMALKMVYEAARAVKIPIIGIGGITSGRDVLEFMLAGARAVQIGTVNLVEPAALVRIKNEIIALMGELKLSDINEMVGELKS